MDDALRGWGYAPTYELHGDALFRAAQARNDPASRVLAVRFGECVYRRLVGSLLHELLHALFGDTTLANYGIPFGLPYGVPSALPEPDEATYLRRFNFDEARAWAGVWTLGRRLFDVAWDVRTARDVGTYCFVGGNALVAPPAGFRAVAHIDRTLQPERYYTRARALEAEASAWLAEPGALDGLVARVTEAASIGARKRPRAFLAAELVADLAPGKIGRNDPCVCGSPQKYKACCGARDAPYFAPTSVSRG